MPSSKEWHQRYLQQARWTFPLRQYLYAKYAVQNARRVLDLGCGTGVLLSELKAAGNAEVIGLDIDVTALGEAGKNCTQSSLILGNAHRIPIRSGCLDVVLCHFLLLWTANPELVISEMVRLTQPGGAVIAIAEPDYPGRIDFPPSLEELGLLQAEALRLKGADPSIGRKLAGLFSKTGLVDLEVGVLGGQWTLPEPEQDWTAEWEVLRIDLTGLVTSQQMDEYKLIEEASRKNGERILFVPTFYACGRKPK